MCIPSTRVGFGRVQNLFLPGQWKKLEGTCFFQFWTGFGQVLSAQVEETCPKPGQNLSRPSDGPKPIWVDKTHLSGQNLSEWTKPIWVDKTHLSGQNLSEWTKPIWVDKTYLGGRNLSEWNLYEWTKPIWVDKTHLSGQNLSGWTKPIWVDQTYMSGRNPSEWTSTQIGFFHSDRFRPLR